MIYYTNVPDIIVYDPSPWPITLTEIREFLGAPCADPRVTGLFNPVHNAWGRWVLYDLLKASVPR